MKKNGHSTARSAKDPAFVIRARRAMHRAARNLRARNRALGLPIIVWEDGKVVEKPV